MKKITAIGTFALIGATVGAAAALPLGLRGSDTLEIMTDEILSLCGIPASDIVYEGGGSSGGEQAMKDLTQQVAPMSRFLEASRTCSHPAGMPDRSEGLAVALDGLSIVTSTHEETNCSGGVRYTGSLPGGYTFGANGMAAWKDALRLLFAGMKNNGGSAIANKNCSAPERAELIADWVRFFEGGCNGASNCDGTALRHAYRRADLSGTTDTFLSLLSLPGITAEPFCNGATYEENDPIETDCLLDDGDANTVAEEQVCSANGKLGVVLPVFVPPPVAGGGASGRQPINDTEIFAPQGCVDANGNGGFFSYLNTPNDDTGAPLIGCPNGATSQFGKCLTPKRIVGGVDNFNCLNARDNCPFGTPVGNKCLGYNAQLRKPDGRAMKDELEKGDVYGAYYRMHVVDSPDDSTCLEVSSTVQIGCLVAHGKCSVGFAGREAADNVAGSEYLKVSGVYPSDANVRLLLTNDPNRYQIARKLYFNTHIGFENVANGVSAVPGSELTLAQCFADTTKANSAATTAGFITLGVPVFCEDFNEQTLCAKPANVNACANNPAPFPN